MTRVVTFLLTTNPEAAQQFYRGTLGLTFVRDDGFALVFDMEGVMLRVNKAPQFTPAQHTVLGWAVDDIHAAVDGLSQRGVVFERYPNMGQDEQGICTFPSGDQVAWFKDPDGNLLSISKHV